ncbi:MAG: hypothetical protein EOP11_17530, partial [Proteobacteria bacterium]
EVGLGQSHQPKENWSKIEWEGWQYLPWANWVRANPARRLNLSVSPFPENQGYSLEACASGAYDSHYKILANRIVANGFEGAILRFGWEFSGNWMPWYPAAGKASTFAGCFRSFVKAVRAAEPGANIQFDYNPFFDVSQAVLAAAYPGDEYVDYIGLDLYDTSYPGYYKGCPIAGCDSTAATNNWNNNQLPALKKFVAFAKLHNKPVSIPEWGLGDRIRIKDDPKGGGDNPVFIRNMLKFIQDPSNRVAYHSYFDVNARDNYAQISGPLCPPGSTTSCTLYPKSAAAYLELITAAGAQDIDFWKSGPTTPTSTETSTSTSTSTSTDTNTNTVVATSAVITPASPYVGGEVNAATEVTATKADSLIVQLVFKNHTDSGVIEMKQFPLKSFAAGKPENMANTFLIPSSLSAGAYRVDTAVYSADLKKLYKLQSSSPFSVIDPVYVADGLSVTPSTLIAGGAVTVDASITSSIKESLIPEFVLHNDQGIVIANKKLTAISTVAGIAQHVASAFDIPESLAPGAYAIDLIVRNADETKVRAETRNVPLAVKPIHKASTAVVNPSSVEIGASFQASTFVSSSADESMVVEFALRNVATGAVVEKKTQSPQNFIANQGELVTALFNVPLVLEPGNYAIDTTLFSASMEVLVQQNGAALSLIPALYSASVPALTASVVIAGGQV